MTFEWKIFVMRSCLKKILVLIKIIYPCLANWDSPIKSLHFPEFFSVFKNAFFRLVDLVSLKCEKPPRYQPLKWKQTTKRNHDQFVKHYWQQCFDAKMTAYFKSNVNINISKYKYEHLFLWKILSEAFPFFFNIRCHLILLFWEFLDSKFEKRNL